MEPDKVFVERAVVPNVAPGGGSNSSNDMTPTPSQWGFFPLSYVAKHLDELDDRGVREKALRKELERVARAAGKLGQQLADGDAAGSPKAFGSGSGGGGDIPDETDGNFDIHVMEGNEHIGARVRRLFAKAEAQDGTIVSWLPPGEDPEDEPLWHVVHDDGDEEDLDATELKEALAA